MGFPAPPRPIIVVDGVPRVAPWVDAADEARERAAVEAVASDPLLQTETLLGEAVDTLNARRPRRADPSPVVEPRTLTLTPASDVQVRPVRWLWDGRLPLGSVTLCGGREGVGKTTVADTLAADVTRGRLRGAYFGTPRTVIIAATEDSREHTIVPRLMAADADLSRVYFVDVQTTAGIGPSLSLPKDLDELERVIRDISAALVILDPLLSRLDAKLDTHKDAEVRQAMEPLVALAGATDACVLGLIHVNKSTSTDALTMLMGSRAFAAVARSVLFVMMDPDDENRRLLGTPKNNLGRTDLPTLAFRIVGVKVADTAAGEVWTGRLDWLGESDRTLTDAIETATEQAGDRTAIAEASDWLADYLETQDGRADRAIIERAGKSAGHTIDALKRARKRLGITSQPVPRAFPRRTEWVRSRRNAGRLNPTAPTAPTAPTGQGRHTDERERDRQSVQSVQSEQSGEAPARASRLDPWANVPMPPGSAEAAARVAARLAATRRDRT